MLDIAPTVIVFVAAVVTMITIIVALRSSVLVAPDVLWRGFSILVVLLVVMIVVMLLPNYGYGALR